MFRMPGHCTWVPELKCRSFEELEEQTGDVGESRLLFLGVSSLMLKRGSGFSHHQTQTCPVASASAASAHGRCVVRVCKTSQLGRSLFPNGGVSSCTLRMAFFDLESGLA